MLRKILGLVSLLLVSRHVASQVCSAANEELLRQRRLQNLRSTILAQLGMTEAPVVDRKLPPSPEILEAYQAITEASLARQRVRDKTCQDRDFYASPVNSFVGNMTPLTINTEEFSGGSLERRSVQEGDPAFKPTNALALYNLSFPFSLAENQTVVESAQLLLFQEAIDTNEYYTAVEQFVEIVALHDTLGKAIVASKYLNIFETGFRDFDLTSNMKEWLASGHRGPLNLEVSVYCFAPSCTTVNKEGKSPKAIQFLSDRVHRERAPRIVVTSQNPLEALRYRNRRQSEGGVAHCIVNQTVCCLRPLIINFQRDLNFTFIVRPDQYEANFCEGVCPIAPGGALMTPRLFQFLNILNPGTAPCCTPNVYHDFPVVIRMGDGTERLVDLRQVQVTSCRCG